MNKDPNTDALMDAMKRILSAEPGATLSNEDLVQCLAFVVGGVSSMEKRVKALEDAITASTIWA